MRRKISPKFHVKNGMKNGKFHANFTLLGRSAEETQIFHFVSLATAADRCGDFLGLPCLQKCVVNFFGEI